MNLEDGRWRSRRLAAVGLVQSSSEARSPGSWSISPLEMLKQQEDEMTKKQPEAGRTQRQGGGE